MIQLVMKQELNSLAVFMLAYGSFTNWIKQYQYLCACLNLSSTTLLTLLNFFIKAERRRSIFSHPRSTNIVNMFNIWVLPVFGSFIDYIICIFPYSWDSGTVMKYCWKYAGVNYQAISISGKHKHLHMI